MALLFYKVSYSRYDNLRDVSDNELWYLFFVWVREYLTPDIFSKNLHRCDFDYKCHINAFVCSACFSLYHPMSWQTLTLQMQYHFVT
jgi:hypothetical protein